MPRSFALVVVAAASLAACTAPPDAVDAPATPGDEATATRVAPRGERAQSGPAHELETLRVAWPARALVDGSLVARLPAVERDKLSAAALPMLLPRAAEMAEHTKLVVRPQFVSASIDADGEHGAVHVFVSASKVAHRYDDMPHVPRTHRVRGKQAWVLQNEGIWSATWEENGVSYVLEVECADPTGDARCQSERYVAELAENLSFVGGSFGAVGGAR